MLKQINAESLDLLLEKINSFGRVVFYFDIKQAGDAGYTAIVSFGGLR